MATRDFHAKNGFAPAILEWYRRYGRTDLPWKATKDPYPIWVSEVMLQQTQVVRVIPYFEAFMAAFPDIASLAKAPLDEVLHHWSGLGYYSRARNLHRAAGIIVQQHQGQFPDTLEAVQALPGLGRSTAGAILGFSLGQQQPILDANVKRVLCRVFAIADWPGHTRVQQQLWQLASTLTPKQQTADYNQAMMDMGATLCRRSRPECERCPVVNLCQARAQNQVSQYPAPAPLKTKPRKELNFFLITDRKDRLLLEQRPPVGIWGGLWSLPEGPLEMAHEELECRFGFCIESSHKLKPIEHSFSHYNLGIFPVHLRVCEAPKQLQDASWLWYNLIQPKQPSQRLGLPAPVLELITQLKGILHGKNSPM